MSARTTGVVARWAGTTHAGRAVICGECGEPVPAGTACPGCYQLAAGRVGMLAALVDTAAGARLVVAERDPQGGWVPIRAVAATGEAVRMIRRQALAPAAGAGGGLW